MAEPEAMLRKMSVALEKVYRNQVDPDILVKADFQTAFSASVDEVQGFLIQIHRGAESSVEAELGARRSPSSTRSGSVS